MDFDFGVFTKGIRWGLATLKTDLLLIGVVLGVFLPSLLKISLAFLFGVVLVGLWLFLLPPGKLSSEFSLEVLGRTSFLWGLNWLCKLFFNSSVELIGLFWMSAKALSWLVWLPLGKASFKDSFDVLALLWLPLALRFKSLKELTLGKLSFESSLELGGRFGHYLNLILLAFY